MRAFTIAAIIAVLAVPANAQNIPILGGDGGRGKLGKKSDEQIAAEQQQKKNEDNAQGRAQENSQSPGQASGPVGKHAIRLCAGCTDRQNKKEPAFK